VGTRRDTLIAARAGDIEFLAGDAVVRIRNAVDGVGIGDHRDERPIGPGLERAAEQALVTDRGRFEAAVGVRDHVSRTNPSGVTPEKLPDRGHAAAHPVSKLEAPTHVRLLIAPFGSTPA